MTSKTRMRFPSDTFVKRQFTYLGEYAHEFHNLPGKYIGSETNEYPDITGSNKKADVVYSVEMDDKTIMLINLEDETSFVNEKTFDKIYGYKNLIFYKNKLPVISAITTTIPLEKCLKEMWISPTDYLKPLIKSLPYEGAWKRLNILIDKCKKQEEFSAIEGLELINMPRHCTKDQDLAVEMICKELLNLNIEDQFVKNELIYSMQCMIHQYAKTAQDITRLEEMIGLQKIMKERSPVLDNMKREGRNEGIEIGRKEGLEKGQEIGKNEGLEEGSLRVLREIASDNGNRKSAEELAQKFGYTLEEVLNSK